MAVRTETLAGQIKGLKRNESISRSQRLAVEDSGPTAVTDALAKLRNQLNQAVGRIRKNDEGSNFRVESAVGVTDDKKALLATVAVTRLDGEEASDDEGEYDDDI